MLVLDLLNCVDSFEFSILGVERFVGGESILRSGGGGIEDRYFSVLSILGDLESHTIGDDYTTCLLEEVPSENDRVACLAHDPERGWEREIGDLNLYFTY